MALARYILELQLFLMTLAKEIFMEKLKPSMLKIYAYISETSGIIW